MVLHLVKDWLGANVSIDAPYLYSELRNKSRPQGSEVWWELFKHWREPDPIKFDKILSKAADHHIAQSRNDTDFVNKKGGMDECYFEFTDINYWLFPIEILAVLRLRECEGLRNPNPPSHDLFHVSSLGPLPKITPEWPHDPLLDAVEKKYKNLFPELPPLPTLADLSALREEQSKPK